MKKIITLIAIIFATTLVGFAQTPTIRFDNGKYDMVLHPTNPNGTNVEVVTLSAYDAVSQTTEFKRIEIEYDVVNPQRLMYDNRKMLNNFATTELIGIGTSLAGRLIAYESAKHNSQFGTYFGIGLAVAGGITCIVGYIPLLKKTDLFVTANGVGVRYKISKLN